MMLFKLCDWLGKKDDGLGTGLVAGLVAGLVYGLGTGLGTGLANLAVLIPLTPLWITTLIISIIVLAEIIIVFEKKEKKLSNQQVLWRKVVALFESIIIIINLLNLKWVLTHVNIKEYLPQITQVIGITGIIIVCLTTIAGIGYLWIQINKKIMTKKKVLK